MPRQKEVRIDIDELAENCGHFTNCETNNGYGCDHPQNTETPGECHRIGCPLAWYDSDKDEMVLFDSSFLDVKNTKEESP